MLLFFRLTKVVPENFEFYLSSSAVNPQQVQEFGQWFFIFVIAWLVLRISVRWLRRKREERLLMSESIVPLYKAPDELTLLEIGLIHSRGRLTPGIIGGTLIQMMINHNAKIEEVRDSNGKLQDIVIHNNIIASKLKPFELLLFNYFFKNNPTARFASLIIGITPQFYQELMTVAYNEVVQKGLFTTQTFKPWLKRNVLASATCIMGCGFVLPVIAILALGMPLLSLMIILLVIDYIHQSNEPRRLTELGKTAALRTKGLWLYLHTAERYRHNFFEQENILDPLLPYSIALDITPLWGKRMEGLISKGFGEEIMKRFILKGE